MYEPMSMSVELLGCVYIMCIRINPPMHSFITCSPSSSTSFGIFFQKEKEKILPDQGVDLGHLDTVQLLNSGLDLGLVGTLVHNEHKGVVIFNLLHGGLWKGGMERMSQSSDTPP